MVEVLLPGTRDEVDRYIGYGEKYHSGRGPDRDIREPASNFEVPVLILPPMFAVGMAQNPQDCAGFDKIGLRVAQNPFQKSVAYDSRNRHNSTKVLN